MRKEHIINQLKEIRKELSTLESCPDSCVAALTGVIDTLNKSIEHMEPFYFTFGSDKNYPFPNRYMIVYAINKHEAIKIFKKYHPNRPGSNAYNASFCYLQVEWEESAKMYYENEEPAEILKMPTLLADNK